MAERPTPPRRLRFQDDDFNAPPASDDMLGEVVWKLAHEAKMRHYRRARWAWTAAAVVCAVAAVAVLWWWSVWPAAAALVATVGAWVFDRIGRPE